MSLQDNIAPAIATTSAAQNLDLFDDDKSMLG